jgi:hypothetical protein
MACSTVSFTFYNHYLLRVQETLLADFVLLFRIVQWTAHGWTFALLTYFLWRMAYNIHRWPDIL